jgi:hypothetical protein
MEPLRMERVLGSHLLWVIVINCDYEKVLINPVIQSKPVIISHDHKNVTIFQFKNIWHIQSYRILKNVL